MQTMPTPPLGVAPGRERTAAGSNRRATRRRAVLAGVGEARNHPERGDQPTQPVALATTAARSALAEAGLAVDSSAVGIVCATVGSDDSPDPAGAVREALGLSGAGTVVAGVGVPQQRLVSSAILAVESGSVDSVLIIGTEAKSSSLTARRSGGAAPETPQGPGADDLWLPEGEFMAEAEVAAAMWDPVTQYALIDSALARAEGRSPQQLRGDVSELWERFDRVAGSNPEACFAAPHTAAELAATTEDNRLLAFPYNKWHSTQWALDHAVALVISAEEVALANGVAADQLVHPRVALDSSWGLSLTRRAEPHRWPMMRIMGEAAAEHLEADLSGIDATELYSCFPASVRVQQRELALAVGGTPTVLGGMPFAGGPFNHFTYMATAELARRLRSGESDLALISTVSGLLTKGGLMVWGREPAPSGALVADVAPEARAATLPQDLAPFDADRDLRADDTVVAATVTGGFDPRVFRIVDDQEGVRHVISRSAEAGEDPLAALT